MAKNDDLDPHMRALLDKAALLTVEQIDEAEAVLSEMGIGGTHPNREYLLAMTMQTLATNLHTVALKSVH